MESDSRFSLSEFTPRGYHRGRGILWQLSWLVVSSMIVRQWFCPRGLRVAILRAFGARIGRGCVIREGVRIHWPWKLTVGDFSWLGQGTWILNLEPVTIGSNTCISQEVMLCTGSHDRRSVDFRFDNAPIVVGDGVWIACRSTVLRGCTVGDRAVIGAHALVRTDVSAGQSVYGSGQ
ncbi:putative colanic acid biosynthesis acetyltransferase [Streptomyces sp. SID6673]|nr:putative colanic acid biosynthesis acetyltransferase [Streptomyces sp. SID11726]NEB27419.1 putative colanic acid biosynthesis acetyltransferase [Streptomyces sp. SID6673]